MNSGEAVARAVESKLFGKPIFILRNLVIVKLGVGTNVELSMNFYCRDTACESHLSKVNFY